MKRRRETTEIVLISTLILMVTLSPLLGVISPRSAMASDEAPWSEIEPEDAELPDEDELEVDARSEPDEPSDAQVDRGPGPPGHANDQAPWSEIESDEPDDFPRSERPPTQPTVEPPAPPWVNIKRPIRPVPSPPGHGRGRPHFEQSDTFQFSSDEETSTVQVQGSSIQSDDFNSTSLNTDLWQFVDPVGDSSYEMRGTNVRVIVPGGTSHDIWSSGNNAPRLVQPAANTDFEVEAKFNTMPSGNNAMQGILVEADAQNFIRFDVYSNSNGLNVFASTFANSSPSIRVNAGITKGAPLYLRVRRIGNQWTYLYSYNGNDWTTAASFTFNLNVSKVGFYAGNSTSNPAFFGTVDYFFNTASPIDPVNPDGSVDTFSPIIHNVTYTPTHDSIAVEWYTDEAATGAVEYGTTGDFELGSVSQEQDLYRHSVVVSGLSQVTNYHLRVTSTDIHGNTSTGSSEVVRTDPSPTSGPYVDVWYGDHQRFGHNGNPQWWVNIHGRVISAHQVTSLSYRLNGGAASSLSIGPDSRRLVNPGDFIIEINYEHLNDGLNSVVISSTDSEGFQSEKTVTIEYDAGNVWPLPYAVDWSTAGEINDVAQVVDGHWAIQGDGVRTLDPGYDRLLAIGDLAWTDYEVEVPITIHSFGAANNGPGVGIVVRWPGHYDWDGSQPRHGWHPLGAIGWYRNNMLQPGHTKLNIYGSGDRILAEDNSGRQLELETPYMFKMRVESRPGQSSLYQVKVWQQGTPEPGEWDLVSGGYPGELTYGSLLLLAHHADATFGSVQVTPLSDEPPPDPDDPTDPQPTDIVSDHFSSTTLNTDVWQYIDPVGDSNLTLTGSHAQIGVPAGSAHDVWTGGNQAPRLMQAANNVDFEIEVKYDSRPSGTHAMQGIIVEGDSQNFLRYDFYSTGDSLNVFAATFSSGSPTVRVNQDVSGDQPMYLRVRREGNQWTLRYSFNGSDWTPVAIFNQSLSVTKVGFFVANAGGNPPAYTGSIDHFIDVDNPEEPGGNPDPDPSPTPTPEPEPDPPSGEVAWVTPAQNAEVSGAIELRVTAPEETVRVEFSAGGVGPLGTDQDGPDSNSEWLVSWDTTLVSNGSYDLLAQAFKVGATSPAAEKQIAVTVANPEAPDNGRVTSGLLALYDFGAGSGNTVHDVSGVGDPLDLHIENTSAASWGEGTLTLSGSNRVSSSGPATKIIDAATASNQVTLEAWITPATASQSGPARVATISDGSLHRNLMLGQGQPNGGNGARYEARLRSTNTNANGVPSVTSANNTAKASLQHVVYTRGTDGVGRLYIDGVEVASASIGGNLSNWDVNYRLALGNEFGIDRAWRGTYHLVAIFDRALSAEEVQKNFGAGPNG